ncbi:CST complex subunit TEN1 [Ascaphus truei]|uniref:CST complex subunit TEN1 n=1 Tax=Ascaphus truei TaxID=8439 RepID=UPI003F59811D
MLPAPAEHHFLWEISAGAVPDGATVRTFGRLSCYDLAQSEATLAAHHASGQHQLRVSTRFVEPFPARVGSHYLALGELDKPNGGLPLLRARLLTCIDGADLSLLQHAVEEQRRYLRERAGTAERDVAQCSAGGLAPGTLQGDGRS